MRTKIKQWWHGFSGREHPLAMRADAGQSVQRKNGTILWEDGDLAKNLKM